MPKLVSRPEAARAPTTAAGTGTSTDAAPATTGTTRVAGSHPGGSMHLRLRGPHDLRHSFSTWLEDEGIPARVIDELMGHQRSRHGELEGGSRIGARYRYTTPQMAARVVQALDRRLTLTLQVADRAPS